MIQIPVVNTGGRLSPQSPIPLDALAVRCTGAVYDVYEAGDVIPPIDYGSTSADPNIRDMVPFLQEAIPTEGATINMTHGARSGMLSLYPATALNAISINLPADADTSVMQELNTQLFGFAIKAVTFNQIGGGAFFKGISTPVEMQSGDSIPAQKMAPNTWVRILKS